MGNFTLVDDAANPAASSEIFSGLAPGTYTVEELVPTDWALTNITCSDPDAVVIDGTRVTITIASGDAVVCTYSDTRTDPPPLPPIVPVVPMTPTPPTTPPTTPPPSQGVAGVSIAPNTRLRVVKTIPQVARVGRRIAFSLTVTNVGSVTARNVILADHPPPAVTLAGPASTTPVRAVRRRRRLAPRGRSPQVSRGRSAAASGSRRGRPGSSATWP